MLNKYYIYIMVGGIILAFYFLALAVKEAVK